jgi:phosphopantetheine adenylyltransferase
VQRIGLEELSFSKPRSFPDANVILEQVHLLSSSVTTISPLPYVLDWGDISGNTAKPFRRAVGEALSACLVDSFYKNSKVTLQGMKRLELDLAHATDDPQSECLDRLTEAVRWVYQTDERPETRKKLLADRITLDADLSKSLLENFCVHIEEALTQAKEQYEFVINNRKDEYAKELRELLKDVRTQADLYAEKTRSIVNGLLRDALGALLLTSLTLFARLSSSSVNLGAIEISTLFKALSIYFIISLILQTRVSCSDIFLSTKELNHWAEAARHYLSSKMVKVHLEDSLSDRRKSFWITLAIISVLYVILAIVSWNIPSILNVVGMLRH